MATNGRKENILTSWKEIAAYLDRDVRTCIRWEKRYGLPVHRLEKDSKAKVFAYKDKVDSWLVGRAAPDTSNDRAPAFPLPGRAVLTVLVLAALAAAAYFLFLRRPANSVPFDFRIAGSELIVVGSGGRKLWTFDTRLRDLQGEAFYRGHFQDKVEGEDYTPAWPYIMIKNITGDARPEVLFSLQTRQEDAEGVLYCFDASGRELWRFEAGRELVYGGKTYRREYRIFGTNVEDYDGDGAPEVLVISFHKPDWPCQIALLDGTGRLEGEYWNAGYIMDAVSEDIDGDGDRDIILSGVNNEYRRGCVAVFEAGNLNGSSPQAETAFQSTALAPGTQSAYILFPKCDVHQAIRYEGDAVNRVWTHGAGGGITALTYETQIFFDLDSRLDCQSVTLSHRFLNLHEGFQKQGMILSVPDREYERGLEEGLLYHEGGSWRARPLANRTAERGPALPR